MNAPPPKEQKKETSSKQVEENPEETGGQEVDEEILEIKEDDEIESILSEHRESYYKGASAGEYPFQDICMLEGESRWIRFCVEGRRRGQQKG
ncbi:hypothetical protein J6590_034575 [Homalodisca vitripennis]|nr:hypothetical protein J6590_034575 [Homalodisca vitripennis]